MGKWGPDDESAGASGVGDLGGAAGSTTMMPVGGGTPGVSPSGSSGTGARGSAGTAPGGSGGRTASATGGSIALAGRGAMGAAGSGTAGAIGSGSGGSSGGATGALSFSVLTHSQGGRFTPRNIGAIWIEDSSGAFVKTLAVWAGVRARYLTKFNAEAGGNRVDAVTSATLNSHTTHSVTWNLSSAKGGTAPNGAYKVLIELTDQDATGKWTSVDFTLDGTPFNMMPADQQYYTGMQLSFK